jgi:pleckstrin family protein A (phosphoinositide binding specific) protein 8
MKISACDVSVHSRDASRLDLIVPGEAHFYLKAASPQERQQWLIALGTAKACLTSSARTPSPSPSDVLPEDELKAKKSELRIYCDLLMQQVHGVKCAIREQGNVDVEQLNESTSLLSATCDTFIQTLDDCVELAHAKFNVSLVATDLNASSISRQQARAQRLSSRQRSISPQTPERSFPGTMATRIRSLSEHLDTMHSTVPPTPDSVEPSQFYAEVFEENGKTNLRRDVEAQTDTMLLSNGKAECRLPSFFTIMPVSFLDIRLTSDGDIPTVTFLDACRCGLNIFDKLNQTAFAPAKLDIAGNIKKIHQKYLSDADAFDTLQRIVRFELQSGQSHLSSSATLALLWLNRSLQFINEFLIGFTAGISTDLIQIANTAYSKSLMPYHGWVVRGAFAMAIKSSPTRAELLASLSADGSHTQHPSFEQSVLHDMIDYSSALSTITRLLHSLFENNNLNFADQV